jgi:hypothetical protein
MTNEEFKQLHADRIIAMRAYFVEAEKITDLLAKCTAGPLSFTERLGLLPQEIIENEAHATYKGAKNLLHGAARLGYGFSS